MSILAVSILSNESGKTSVGDHNSNYAIAICTVKPMFIYFKKVKAVSITLNLTKQFEKNSITYMNNFFIRSTEYVLVCDTDRVHTTAVSFEGCGDF